MQCSLSLHLRRGLLVGLAGDLVPHHPCVLQQPVRLGREDQEALNSEVIAQWKYARVTAFLGTSILLESRVSSLRSPTGWHLKRF